MKNSFRLMMPEMIETLKRDGEMTVPLEIDGREIGDVTVIADDVGLMVKEIDSKDGLLRSLIVGKYIFKFKE